MATKPTHAVIATFTTEDGAGAALGTLNEAKESQGLGIQNAAILRMGEDGKLHIKETDDMTAGKGLLAGGVVGGVVGILGSAVLLPLGIGAIAGGLAAKLRDSGFPDDRLKDLGASLQPGNSVLVVAIDEGAEQAVEQALQAAGAQVVRAAVEGELAAELDTDAAASAETPSTAEPPTVAAASEEAIPMAAPSSPEETSASEPPPA